MFSQNSPDRTIQGSRQVSLRLILVIPLVLQIFAAVGVTGWISWRNCQKTVNDLRTQLIDRVTARVEQRVRTSAIMSDRTRSSNSRIPSQNDPTELTVSEMSQFLQSLTITEFFQMAIVEPSGKILASSGSEIATIDRHEEPPKIPAIDRNKRLIPAAINYLQMNPPQGLAMNQRQSYSFEFNGQRQLLQVTPIADDRGLDWLVLVVIPESALMAAMNANIQTTIFWGVGALGLAIFSGLMTSELISYLIRQFIAASRAIGQGNLAQTVGKSSIKEWDSFAETFNKMSQQLQDSFAQLETQSQALSQQLLERDEAIEREKHDRHIVEQQLHTSERKMRAFFESMNDIIILFDTDGNLEIAPTNPSALYGPDTDIIGLTIEYLFQDENFLELQEKIQLVLASEKTLNFDYSLDVDDQERWFAARVSRVSENSVIWVARDISDRKETEIALHFAQQQSESLLLNILPKSIAEQLKQSAEAIAEHFDEATILFSDIVGFTPMSARLSAIELVKLLNDMFSRFDKLAEKYKLEKIKTIGDAYMVAAGLPLHRIDHAEAIANMALDMQTAIQQFSLEHNESLQIRIGIHSGPVVAGVIGTKKFIYDLWGDTVNVASRMESSGCPGRIQVTGETYERLKHQYILEKRGQISVKGKGEMITYWLVDIKK